MVQALVIVSLTVLSGCFSTISSSCTDSLLLTTVVAIERCDIDTSGHWWAIVQPFTQAKALVVDGKSYGVWDTLQPPAFAYDGSTWIAPAVRSGQVAVITPDGPEHRLYRILGYSFPTESAVPWFIEEDGANTRITNGERLYTSGYAISDFCIHPSGMVVAWVERRDGVDVLLRNGLEVARSSLIHLYAVWANADCLYTVTNGIQTTLHLGATEIAGGIRQMAALRVNPSRTIAAWQASNGSGVYHSYLYTDDYVHPWEGPPVVAPDLGLALSPFDALIAYRGTVQGSKVVGYNAATYPQGLEASAPVFSHNGAVMAYCSKDNADYVVINGKRILVNASVPTTDTIAVSSTGETVAWCSSTTLVVLNLEFTRLTMGKMCDSMGRAVFDRRTGTFKALGIMGGRLYMLSCTGT